MNTSEVMTLLEANKNERGIQNWEAMEHEQDNLESYGIGLTVLRKLAKKIGRDHELALKLWQTNVYDAKTIALLIDDPKLITREQAEEQVDNLNDGLLVHVFSSCNASLGKVSFVVVLVDDWIDSNDRTRRVCGYGLLYEISKSKKKSAPDDNYFLEHIKKIQNKASKGDMIVAMGLALMGIGKRNAKLNAAALEVAREIGPIDFSGDGNYEPFDVVKHLTKDWLQKKLAST